MKKVNIFQLSKNSNPATKRLLKLAKKGANALFPRSKKLDHAFHISPIIKLSFLYLHYCKKIQYAVSKPYQIALDLNNPEIVDKIFKCVDEELGVSDKVAISYVNKNDISVPLNYFNRKDLKINSFLKNYTKYENGSIVLSELGEITYNQIIEASKQLISTC